MDVEVGGTQVSPEIRVDQEILGHLQYIMASPAWRGFFVPFLEGMKRGFEKDLADPSKKRIWEKPDDYLRGGIGVVHALLTFPQQVIAEEERQDEQVARLKTVEEHYQQRADEGRIGPHGMNIDEIL